MKSTRHPVCLVLGYHEIAPLRPGMRRSLMVSPTTFATHLTYLRLAGFRCIDLTDVGRYLRGETSIPSRAVAITFDDGYIGNARHAVPLLRRFGFRATLFVPSRLLGGVMSRDDSGPSQLLSRDAVYELHTGGVAIGAHTQTHADLTTLPPSSIESEVAGSRRELETILDASIPAFAYPFGRHHGASVAAVREAGYTVACTTSFSAVCRDDDPYLIPRVMIGNNMQLPWFIYRLRKARGITRQGARADEPSPMEARS